jgi:hypothetical protein
LWEPQKVRKHLWRRRERQGTQQYAPKEVEVTGEK